MIFYERKVTGETKAERHAYHYQAALNSDGEITIRGKIEGLIGCGENDESMLVLSQAETESIFELMKRIGRFATNTDLPF